MKLETRKENANLTVSVTGSIDTVTAPELEKLLNSLLDEIAELRLDFTSVDYISSAGLRIVMATDQRMSDANGKMIIENANEDVKEVFEMTGFDTILTFE